MATRNMRPTSATVFAYQVGFGDCFLVRFHYPSEQRHILIDFGTTGLPKETADNHLTAVANDIAAKCAGKLHAVVATHRHGDHISGFATKANGKGPGDIIRSLNPEVVVQPWTEDPDLPKDAKGPKGLSPHHAALALSSMQEVSQKVLDVVNADARGFSASLAGQLRFLGEDNIKNRSAVENLMTMGKKRVYVYHESASGLEAVLPGIKTHVLGPPTLKQTDAIARMRSSDPDEFWQLQARRLTKDEALVRTGAPLFPQFVAARRSKLPLTARWLAYRLTLARGDQLLQIVRTLDDQMNNTSVILLFQSKNAKLLFPGDAQIENWAYTLSKEKYRKLLADVDLYKVGHHGSRNATPRSMWNGFKKKGPAKKADRLKSILSTMPDKHGSEKQHTEVPRDSLVKELDAQSWLSNTHNFKQGVLCEAIEIAL